MFTVALHSAAVFFSIYNPELRRLRRAGYLSIICSVEYIFNCLSLSSYPEIFILDSIEVLTRANYLQTRLFRVFNFFLIIL